MMNNRDARTASRPYQQAQRLLWGFVVLLLVGGISVTVQGEPADPSPQAPGKIEGAVTTPDGHAVASARVNLITQQNSGERRIHSDSDGRFSFSDLPPGTYELRVELEGFERLTQTVQVRAGETTSLNLTLALVPLTETMTVTATRAEQKLGDIPVEISVLTRDDIKRSAALTVDDLLKQIPSFSLFRRTSSLVSQPTTQGVSLRGIGASGASRTLVMLDGVPHNDPFGNWVYWSKIPQSQIESIEVAEGGLSNIYGSSAMAGVINVVTKRPEQKTIVVKAQGGMRETGDLDLFASHEFGPLAASIGGSLFRTGGYNLIRKEERGLVDVNAESRHQTGNWRLDYSPTRNVTLFHNGRFFNENRDNGTPLQFNSSREVYLGGGLRATTSDGSDWQANVFSHIDTFKSSFSAVAANRNSETLTLVQDVPYRDVGANGQWFRRFADVHLITIGADTRWIKANNKEDVFIPTGANVRDRFILGKQLYAGMFVQDFMTPTRRFVLAIGARIDYWKNLDASRREIVNATQATTVTNFPDTSKTTVTPRAGILYHFTDNFAVRGAFYQGFRAPTLNELYRPFRVGNVQTEGNANLEPERLTGGEIGFNHIITRNLFWRVTGFWNRLKDPISNVTISVTQNLITRQRQNLGRARIRGIDAEFEYRINPQWNFRGHYLFDEATVEKFPADRNLEGKLIPQVPKHRAILGLNYLNPAWVNVSLQGRVESLRFDDDLNQFKLGSFFVTDLAVSRPLGELWEAFLSVENLFDRQYAVQATPVESLGTPIIVSGGIRFHIFPR
ncbi:MAG: TonB-dependent receptor [Acidobacteria bacterium]|nr:TonB-dependent receptor [Acidobacteriota bacterium]